MYRVVLVDDHAAVRRALIRLVNGFADFRVVGEASDGASGLEVVRREQPTLLVTDLSMPGVSGFSLLASVREEFPGLPVVAVSITQDAATVEQVRALGGLAFVDKNRAAEELSIALNSALSGRWYCGSTAQPMSKFA